MDDRKQKPIKRSSSRKYDSLIRESDYSFSNSYSNSGGGNKSSSIIILTQLFDQNLAHSEGVHSEGSCQIALPGSCFGLSKKNHFPLI